jgi:alpha-1,2-mannosyltransferase
MLRKIDTHWIFYKFIAVAPPIIFFSFIIKICYSLLYGSTGGTDFLVFWYASAWAAKGKAASLYDIAALPTSDGAFGGLDFPICWFYPPPILLILLPLSFMPYLVALCVWLSSTLFCYVGVLRRIAPHHSTTWLALAFPATLVNIGYAHNGFLSAAILGGGLLLLDRYALAGGFLLGLLTYKPQLALLISIALIAARKWKSFFAFLISSSLLVLISALVFGLDTWVAFFRKIPVITMFLEGGYNNLIVDRQKMASVYSAVLLAGASLEFARILHGIIMCSIIAIVGWVWSKRVSMPIRSSVLVLGTLLFTPYLFEYELTLLALVIAWISWEGITIGFLAGEKTILSIAWLTPLLSILSVKLVNLSVTPVVLMILLYFVLKRSNMMDTVRPA